MTSKDLWTHRDKRSFRTIAADLAREASERLPALDRERLALIVGGSAIGYAVLPQLAPAFIALTAAAIALKLGREHALDRAERPGIMHMGNDIKTRRPYWLGEADILGHSSLFGTTGMGKTEVLLGLAENALRWSSGFLFMDGKGDLSIRTKVMSIARTHGRVHDVLVLDAMAGGRPSTPSNTMNPFARIGDEPVPISIGEILPAFPGHGGHQAKLYGHYLSLLAAALPAPDPLTVAAMAEDATTIQHVVSSAEGLDELAEAAQAYLNSLPGFEIERGIRQTATVGDLHSSIRAWAKNGLEALRDAWAPMMPKGTPDIDMLDVLVNRRILVVSLPSLERSEVSGDERGAMVGRAIMQALRAAMIAMLRMEHGAWGELIDAEPTISRPPFLAVLDEFDHYASMDMVRLCAYARSLRIGMTFACTDVPSLKRRNEKAGAAVLANTVTKMFMRIDEDDMKRATRNAGKELLKRTGIAAPDEKAMVFEMEARIEDVDRIGLRDMHRMQAGQMTLLHGSEVVELIAPYPSASDSRNKPVGNQFIAVDGDAA